MHCRRPRCPIRSLNATPSMPWTTFSDCKVFKIKKGRTKKLLCSRTYAGGPREAVHPLPNQDDSATLELEQDHREIEEIAI